MKVADIGSSRMDSLMQNHLKPKIDELFGESDVTATIEYFGSQTKILYCGGKRGGYSNFYDWIITLEFSLLHG